MRCWWIWLAGAVGVLAVVAVAVSFVIDEPVRRCLERQVNARLQGYTVRIGALDLHPLGFSAELEDVSITQDAHPDPPVVRVPTLSAGVQWRALLRARVVADLLVERPALHLNLTQLAHEARDEVPVRERGWQEAVQAVSPLPINEVRVVEGEVTYIDQAASQPVHLRQLNARAGSIENTHMPALNPLLRAHGKLDVVGGFFSLYTEMRVKNRAVQGYVKPLMRELDVYDASQDRGKTLFQPLYEAVVGGMSELLENLPCQEVAAKADIGGPLEDLKASTWQVVVTLIQNAFLKPSYRGSSARLATPTGDHSAGTNGKGPPELPARNQDDRRDSLARGF